MESSTRALVFMAPVSFATTLVSSKIRRERCEARRRLRWPTSVVWSNASQPAVDPRYGLPAQVHFQTVARLPVREPLEALEEHGRGQDSGRDGGAALGRALVEVGEVVVGEHLVAVIGEESVERSLLEPVAEDLSRILEALPRRCRSQCHPLIVK